MAWNYAELSSEAKKVGGPEALMDALVQSGRDEMKPFVVFAGLFGLGVGALITKITYSVKQKYREKEMAMEQVKRDFVIGINEYDALTEEQKAEFIKE